MRPPCTPRHSATNTRLVLPLAWMAGPVGRPFVIALTGGLLLRNRRRGQGHKAQRCGTQRRGKDLSHRTSPRLFRPTPTSLVEGAGATELPQQDPAGVSGSAGSANMFPLCSSPCQEQKKNKFPPGEPPRTAKEPRREGTHEKRRRQCRNLSALSARSASRTPPPPPARCSPRFRSAWPCPRPTRSARACSPVRAPAPRPCARPGRCRGSS
jgi:hypothetical protein